MRWHFFATSFQLNPSFVRNKSIFDRVKSLRDEIRFAAGDKDGLNFIETEVFRLHQKQSLSRIQIEELILNYEPTMLFVEHDKAFIECIAMKRIEL